MVVRATGQTAQYSHDGVTAVKKKPRRKKQQREEKKEKRERGGVQALEHQDWKGAWEIKENRKRRARAIDVQWLGGVEASAAQRLCCASCC